MAIFIGVGANIVGPYGPPRASCEAALRCLERVQICVDGLSSWWKTAPVPKSDQPWYINGVARVTTPLSPSGLLTALHEVEKHMGRVRTSLNASRCIDLDLLAYGEECYTPDDRTGENLCVPHPRMHERAFVLLPLKEISPHWIHPRLRMSLSDLLESLPAEALCQKIHPNAD